ncbi:MAG: gliding motility protein GldM [Bacteroidetes bacterium]|jgi:gliding motility-associated protein GldM|nr:gliding motility protein GldM [Bacteroidota bacterium]
MANAKETPRQKMIGMMYLVLTCLLALNVSKEVLEGFVTINESIENTNLNFTTNTKMMMEALDEAVKNGRNDVKPYFEKAKETVQLSQKTFDYVGELKKQVQQYTEDIKGADTMKLSRIEKLDDFDKPTFLLIGSDETKPKTGQYSAKELRQNMEHYSATLSKMIDEMKDKQGSKLPEKDYLILKDKLRLFTPHDNFKNKENKPVSWEFKNFYNMPLAAVVTNLSKIQSDIRSIEAGMVSTFAGASGKLTPPMNKLSARIIPSSQYVQAGTPFSADVFLSATSSHFTDDNIQFILGDVDTTSGKLGEGAVVLPVDNGNGKITIPTSGSGHKDIHGWIKFKDGNGVNKYYRYDNNYVVASAAAAVSADKMNVMYIGVENPISVSAAGIAPTDLQVSISGCGGSLSNSGNGKYNAKVTSTGTCMVTVMAKTPTGMKAQGPPQPFRVKRIPNPPLKVANQVTFGNLDLKQNITKTINGIGLDGSGFDYSTTCKVKECTMMIVQGGVGGQEYKCINGQLPNDAKAALSRIKPGSKVFFENIRIIVAGEERDAGLVKINVK